MTTSGGEVALLGTGVATLVAAAKLIAEGRSVWVLNPDGDFFSEDSELSFDPLLPHVDRPYTLDALSALLAKKTHDELSPNFPGAVEVWPFASDSASEFHDSTAPFVRERSRLWIQPTEPSRRIERAREWERVEDLYLRTSEGGLNPQILSGVFAFKKFPGVASHALASDGIRGILLPRLCDVDVSRYRHGLLEYVSERLGAERVICGASQVEMFQDGIRFHSKSAARTALVKDLLVFWTPRLTQWLLAQAKRAEKKPILPAGIRLWEEWKLNSRDSVDMGTIGVFEDQLVWADFEGAPQAEVPLKILSVLRAGPMIEVDSIERSWITQESFAALSRLCHGFLGWDRFSVRSVRTRAIFEWNEPKDWEFFSGGVRTQVVSGCDGPIVKVVQSAHRACQGVQ